MNLQFSLYLDVIRFSAALLVLISHANVRYLSTDILPLSTHGHFAVMIFFVLSGYVIAYVTDVKENTFSLYWASRLSRIYSVALPAVLATPLLDLAGMSVSQLPVIYDHVPMDLWLVRLIASLFFVNEIWFNSIMSFSNTPFWSLCYEMSYYFIFALFVFLKGRTRWFALALTCLIVGPKILLLFPVWLLGVYLYRSKPLSEISYSTAWALFIVTTVILLLWEYHDLSKQISEQLKLLIGPEYHYQMAFSKYFLGDWVLGILIMLNFAGFRKIGPDFAFCLNPFQKIIRYAASFTLTLYLFHQPLLYFFSALIHGEKGAPSYFWQVICATLVTIYVLGILTEHRRSWLRQWLRMRLEVIESNPYMRRLLK